MPKFAKTLEIIRDDPESFYNGSLAKDIVKDIKDGGGIVTLEDLKNYTTAVRTPLSEKMGDYTWYTNPPPGSGAVLSLILNILKGKVQQRKKLVSKDWTVFVYNNDNFFRLCVVEAGLFYEARQDFYDGD